MPNDPIPTQLHSTVEPKTPFNAEIRGWWLKEVGAYGPRPEPRGDGITIAVLDTGIDLDHPDLAANLWVNQGEIASNGIDDDGNGRIDDVHGWNFSASGADADVDDRNGHGSHVAGLAAAVADNDIGVAGVAPDAELMAVKVADDNGDGSSLTVAQGILYAIEMGARIVNVSLGGTDPDWRYEQALGRAQEAGVIVVVSAGNESHDEADYPARYTADYDNVLSVAASTGSGKLTHFSNYSASRTTVSLAAPGKSILSTSDAGGYATMTGTSMAAPMVAGAAAVIWSARPDWSYAQVIDVLIRGASEMTSLVKETASNGILDLAAALALLDEPSATEMNGAPDVGLDVLVSSLDEGTVPPEGGLLVANISVTDDGVGVAMLELSGGDLTDFEIRDGGLWLREGAVLDFEARPELSVTITVDDPEIGDGPEAQVTYTLTVLDLPEELGTPPQDADAFAGLAFWYDTAADIAEDTNLLIRRLTDRSGGERDARAGTRDLVADPAADGLTFDGTARYRIRDDEAVNTADVAEAKTLSFHLTTGDDVAGRQVVYEQGGGSRGLSVIIEDGALHVTGWSLRDGSWGLATVSTEIAAGQTLSASLVLDGTAGTLMGYLDGLAFGTSDGAGPLHRHGDNVGLGGVHGKTRDADGTLVLSGESGFIGILHEAASHNVVLDGDDIGALHAGFAAGLAASPEAEAPEPAAATSAIPAGSVAEAWLGAGADTFVLHTIAEDGGADLPLPEDDPTDLGDAIPLDPRDPIPDEAEPARADATMLWGEDEFFF